MARSKQLIARAGAVWIFSDVARCCLTTFDFASDGCAMQQSRRVCRPKKNSRTKARDEGLLLFYRRKLSLLSSASLERLTLSIKSRWVSDAFVVASVRLWFTGGETQSLNNHLL